MGILDQRNRGDFFVRNLGRDAPYRRCVSESSFNGGCQCWMYKYPAGIRLSPDAPAFKKILIQPCFLSDLDFVEASHESMYGTIRLIGDGKKGRSGYIWFCLQRLWLLLFCPGKAESCEGGRTHFCHSRIVNMFV